MLGQRLVIWLLAMVCVLWCTGATALILNRLSVARFESKFQRNIVTMDAAMKLRTLSVTLDSRYLPALAGGGADLPPDRAFFDATKVQILQELEVIQSRNIRDSRWMESVGKLKESLDLYLGGYERVFAQPMADAAQRQKLIEVMAANTRRRVEDSNALLAIAGGWLLGDAGRLDEEATSNTWIVGSLVLMGTLLAAFGHRELSRHIVEPITSLTRSVEEIRKGNFETVLPVPGLKHELTGLVVAFNEMAGELRKWRGESDESLKRANIVNRAILEAIPSPVFVLGNDGRIIQMNPSGEKLTESLEAFGRLPLKFQRMLEDCRANHCHYLPQDPKDALLFRINEEEHYYLPRIFHFESGEESLSGWAVLLHNVSRIRWLDDMKTGLIAKVSHEIKTPLTGIRMVLLLLLEERSGPLDEIQKTLITSASGDCERLLGTVNGLLELATSESGASHLNRVPIDLQVIAEKSVERIFLRAKEKSLVMQIEETEQRFPKVLADPERLDEVLNNLLSNAISYSPQGGEITLRLSKPDAEHIRLSVIDHGPGVPEASEGRIFERFYRAPGQQNQGLGLGLFISRDIMIAHGGRIGLLDRTDSLTEFFIDVPIA